MVKWTDLIGMRFGRWTVIKYSHKDNNRKRIFECLCDCGNKKLVHKDNLVYGKSNSCGCMKGSFEDLVGKRFGSLRVLKETKERKNTHKIWLCQCDCGNEHKVTTNALKTGEIKSCGCSNKPNLIGLKFGKLKVSKESKRKVYGKRYWKCVCQCGNSIEVSTNSLMSGNTKSCGCVRAEKCKMILKKTLENRRGKKHYNYNPNITEEERVSNRYEINGNDRRKWRKEVFQKDDYACVHCKVKGGMLNAHHLNGYSWYKEGRYDVSNGVTLCKSCHMEFHNKYGYGDNTKEQFDDFLSSMILSD